MPGEGKPFKPGESGNPNGRPKKGESITDLMQETLQRHVDTKEGKVMLKDLFCKKLVEMGLKGDIQALKLIWNYIDGMPVQKNINDDTLSINDLPDININVNKNVKPES